MKKRTSFCVVTALLATIAGALAGPKVELTPAFWQKDPEAGFEDDGAMHCAPTAVSDGLIYLARHNGFTDLVPGSSHRSQIELIEELAEDFDTDPAVGGTNPDKILTGVQSFVESKGYDLDRLELKSWRRVSADNNEFKIGTKPDMPWMRKAARSEDTVVIFNFGWYYEDKNGGYTRKGGHWVAVLDADDDGTFLVHNPLLEPRRQMNATAVTLNLIDDDFEVTNDDGLANMKGYYEADGPGLPHGKTVKPILDAVLVFTLDEEER